VMRDRKLLTLNEEEVRADANLQAGELFRRAGIV
jgi:hypothetical protein